MAVKNIEYNVCPHELRTDFLTRSQRIEISKKLLEKGIEHHYRVFERKRNHKNNVIYISCSSRTMNHLSKWLVLNDI